MESINKFMENSTALSGVSTGLQIGGSLMKGFAAKDAAKYEAEMMRRRATQEYATMTQEAQRRKREGDRMISNARAVMAGSGGVTTDAGATSQLGDITSQRDFNVMAAIYEGEVARQEWQQKAENREYEGRVAMTTAVSSAMSSAFDEFSKRTGQIKKVKKPEGPKGLPSIRHSDEYKGYA